MKATGGDSVYEHTDLVDGKRYQVHAFTTVGNSFFNAIDGRYDLLIVGGGGDGGAGVVSNNYGLGGGGAGRLIWLQNVSLSAGTYVIAVGNANENSQAFGLTALAGGKGGAWLPVAGGCGGGGGSLNSGSANGAEADASQGGVGFRGGAAGGFGDNLLIRAGGGGGTGSVGQDGVYGGKSGDGGEGWDGRQYFGTAIGAAGWFAGGGGGVGRRNNGAPGIGKAGGGSGKTNIDALPSTGSGGGTNGTIELPQIAGKGGSGVVIVRYLLLASAHPHITHQIARRR